MLQQTLDFTVILNLNKTMKPKFIILLLSIALLYLDAEAQEYNSFYYHKGKKVPLTISDQKFYIPHTLSDSRVDTSKFGLSMKGNGFIVSSKHKSKADCNSEIERLKKNKKVNSIQPVIENGIEIPLSGEFYVRLKTEKDTTKLKKLATNNGCVNLKKVELMPFWYSLKTNIDSKGNALEMANYFYETGLFSKVDPGFMLDFKTECSSEPKFNEQWGLQTNVSGEYDINLCEAWTITKGSPSVLVAVYDSGIDTTGIEFTGRLHNKSFDSEYLFNYVFYRDFLGNKDHGTNVASVIAANENNNLMVGVAPNVKLMNISHSFRFIENATVHHAKGISFAWRNGAHIINNSWGDNGNSDERAFIESEILEDAIDSAMVHGRGGLGTIVIFASGNSNQNFVNYPASYSPELLVVGASNRQGQRAIFNQGKSSCYGSGLDIIAPGLNLPVVSKNNIYTLSGGTSFAAPHVSGVVALMLSVAPNLSRADVVSIIERTAQKTGGYNYQPNSTHPNGTWHEEVGHGLLDANAAVLEAQYCALPVVFNNQTVIANTIINGCNITSQNVTIQNNSKLVLDATNSTTIVKDFEVKLGSQLEIK